MSKKALRRHHRARILERARSIRRRWWSSWEPDQWKYVPGGGKEHAPQSVDHSEADASAAKIADHLAACSCVMCGNPRRYGDSLRAQRTRQEIRAELAMREQLGELDRDEE